MKKIILTGDRPTGRLHLGHDVGSLKRRVELQNSGEFDKVFIMIADLSCGLDPAKSTIFIQSQIAELCELTFYYMNLVTVSRLQRNPTVKTEIQMRNFETSIPVGFFTYPISQASDITAFKATTVPAGEDQEPTKGYPCSSRYNKSLRASHLSTAAPDVYSCRCCKSVNWIPR